MLLLTNQFKVSKIDSDDQESRIDLQWSLISHETDDLELKFTEDSNIYLTIVTEPLSDNCVVYYGEEDSPNKITLNFEELINFIDSLKYVVEEDIDTISLTLNQSDVSLSSDEESSSYDAGFIADNYRSDNSTKAKLRIQYFDQSNTVSILFDWYDFEFLVKLYSERVKAQLPTNQQGKSVD